MNAIDAYIAGIPAIVRTLNQVRTNRQAIAVADYALVEAQNQIEASEFAGAGYYSGATVARDLQARIAQIQIHRRQLSGAGTLDNPVSQDAWAKLRHDIEGVFIDAAPIYVTGSAKLQDIGTEALSIAGKYVEKLAEDPTAVPAIIAADIARVIAHNAHVATDQAVDIAKTEIAPALWSLSPFLAIAGVAVAVYLLAPALIARKLAS